MGMHSDLNIFMLEIHVGYHRCVRPKQNFFYHIFMNRRSIYKNDELNGRGHKDKASNHRVSKWTEDPKESKKIGTKCWIPSNDRWQSYEEQMHSCS